MQEAFDGWCSFSKLCLVHFRCIRPTSFGIYVFNLTSSRVKVWLEDGWEPLYLCWQVESGKHCGRGRDAAGGGRDSKIESEWKKPYKERERQVSAADTDQTADKGRWDERRENERMKERKAWHVCKTETREEVALGEQKQSEKREDNVMLKEEAERDRWGTIGSCQWILVIAEAFLTQGWATAKFIFK